jgi:meso-butanediol dehydrogenase/(S,S)-butanediol dehydrogenase/diacetyl reductase
VIEGRRVLVTGASRGLGRVMCQHLAAAGAQVALMSRPGVALDAAAAQVGGLAVPCDVGDPTSVRAAFADIEARLGGLDALVNNAALAWPGLVEESSDEQIDEQVRTNLLGPLYAVRSAVPMLRRSADAHIVNISSESVADPFPYLALYAATKAALENLSIGLAHELKPDRIRVTLLQVGRTQTGFKDAWDEDVRARAVQAWSDGGFTARVSGGATQPPDRVAESLLHVLAQPPGSTIDRIHVKAY